MAFTVQMPALGESVTEGTVTRWLKQEGDRVEVDEPLLEVSTDKVDTEIPSPAAGVLERIVAGEDETVEVGGDLAVIGDGDGGGSGGDGRPRPRRRTSDSGRLRRPGDDSGEAERDEAEGRAPPRTESAAEPASDGGSDAPQYPNKAAEPAADAGSDTSSDSGATKPSGGRVEGGSADAR